MLAGLCFCMAGRQKKPLWLMQHWPVMEAIPKGTEG